MTDTSKFRADVLKLFEPRPPLEHIEYIDIDPAHRKTPHIGGIGPYLEQLKAYSEVAYEATPQEETKQMKEKRIKHERQQLSKKKMDDDFAKWDPQTDPHIKGDPHRTVFVGRLDYNISEIELQKEFTKFGPIETVRVVRDKESGKSKGYGFVLFERESGARMAYKEGNGMKLGGRDVLTDVEKGRVSKSWLPRRLGGGVGGRGYSQKRHVPEIGFKKKFDGPSTPRSRDGGSRFPRGGRSESFRPRYDPRSKPGDQGSSRPNYSSYGSPAVSYQSRSERPDRTERRSEPEKTLSYSSRSRREDRDFKDRERDRDRDSRMGEKEKERLRY